MKTFLVTVDCNDADYSSDIVEVSDEDFEKFLPILQAIDNFQPYFTRFGPEYGNWENPWRGKKDGFKSVHELYPQFSEDYIDEFTDKFLSISLGGNEGFHSIIGIQEIILGQNYVHGAYEDLKYRNHDEIEEYQKKVSELTNYTTKYGKNICSTPYNKLTKEELERLEEYHNLWLKYRPDLKILKNECLEN